MAPPLVCVTWQTPGEAPGIEHHSTVKPRLEGWLRDPNVRLVGQNIAYDLAVVGERFPDLLPLIFKAYDDERITDTMIRQWLLDTAAGVFRGRVTKGGRLVKYEYTLEALAKRCANIQLQKDAWRTSYGSFLDVPLAGWVDRARIVQAEARPKLAALEADLAAAPKSDRGPLEKRVTELREMIDSPPEQCLKYPLDDARATLAVYQAQEKHAAYLKNQYAQTYAYWSLHLNSAWGLRTDEAGARQLRRIVEADLAALEDELVMLGLVRPNGVKNMKAARARMVDVCKREDLPLIRTKAHFADGRKDGQDCPHGDACTEHVCLDADACERSDDEVLMHFSQRTTLGKQLSNDIPMLEGGIEYPVHTRYGWAATGRTTSSKPNIQNQSKREGFRECFVARDGYLFADADFPTLELYTLAQCCVSWVGHSKLAEALLTGLDPHIWVAAIILKTDYATTLAAYGDPAHPLHTAAKRARQLAKPANFGFGGGMGPAKFVSSTRKQVLAVKNGKAIWEAMELDEARAKLLKDEWLTAWPEMEAYFARVRALVDNEFNRANVETLFTHRWRGAATYCATANNGFQALGADCAKAASTRIARAAYVGTPSADWAARHPGVRSPLYNARPCAFVHDQFMAEVPANDTAHDAAFELAAHMVEGANTLLPDVPIKLSKVKPALMKRWSKGAEAVFDARGRLVPWVTKEAA